MVLAERYRLREVIGKGGMGVVHRAVHVSTDRQVAVKLLQAKLAEKDAVKRRFEREAKAAARIDHDNICEVLDFGVADDGAHFLVMPLLRGRPLRDVIREVGHLPIERACDITTQILAALGTAHRRGVIHRDLKPDNIFLTKVGDRADFVKILDFGITKFDFDKKGADGATDLTSTGEVFGTAYYMAPEQARGEKDIDGRADIYAVGVILNEMLTGKRPFVDESLGKLLWKLWNDPIKPPSSHRPEITKDMEAVTLRAFARDPEKRFHSSRHERCVAQSERCDVKVSSALCGSAPTARRHGSRGDGDDRVGAPGETSESRCTSKC